MRVTLSRCMLIRLSNRLKQATFKSVQSYNDVCMLMHVCKAAGVIMTVLQKVKYCVLATLLQINEDQ
jgi:hypothetical protein